MSSHPQNNIAASTLSSCRFFNRWTWLDRIFSILGFRPTRRIEAIQKTAAVFSPKPITSPPVKPAPPSREMHTSALKQVCFSSFFSILRSSGRGSDSRHQVCRSSSSPSKLRQVCLHFHKLNIQSERKTTCFPDPPCRRFLLPEIRPRDHLQKPKQPQLVPLERFLADRESPNLNYRADSNDNLLAKRNAKLLT